MTLENLCFQLWKTKYERRGIQEKFMPTFHRFIGVEGENYNDVLKTLITKVKEDEKHSILFDGNISMTPDFNLITAVTKELETADVTNLSSDNFRLFQDDTLNNVFLDSLNYVTQLAIQNENFLNKSVRNNFVMQMILYAYNHIFHLDFKNADIENLTMKCIYYGDIQRRDIYFLILLYRMTFDVVYINPLRERDWDVTDTDKLSSKTSYPRISEILNLTEKTKDAHVIQMTESVTLQFEQQIQQELFTDTGMFQPWQLRGYNVNHLLFRGNMIDLRNNWNEQARVRSGFKVDGHTVTIPHMFYCIEGTDTEYKKTVMECTRSDGLFELNGETDSFIDTQKELTDTQFLQFAFCQLSDGSFHLEQLQELPFYPFRDYSKEFQKLVIDKVNEIVLHPSCLRKDTLTQQERMEFLATIFAMRKEICRLIDGFDYAGSVPKIVYILPNEATIQKRDAWILAFLNNIAFDIVVLSPSGMSKLTSYLDDRYVCTIRLERMQYDMSFQDFQTMRKKTRRFLSGLFSR